MKHLKLFETQAQYESFKSGDDFILPNVSCCKDGNLYYNPLIESASSYVAVDLGLPSGRLWANMNVGATSPEDPGLYFQWGATTGYTIEELQDSELCESIDDFNNYFDGTPAAGFKKYDKNKLLRLEPSDDAASVHMGGSWRMPTTEELNELFSLTTKTLYDAEGNEITGTPKYGQVKYVKFSSTVNDNSIIFWYSGYCSSGYPPYTSRNDYLYLWSSDIHQFTTFDYPNAYMNANCQRIDWQRKIGGMDYNNQISSKRCACIPIRAVR